METLVTGLVVRNVVALYCPPHFIDAADVELPICADLAVCEVFANEWRVKLQEAAFDASLVLLASGNRDSGSVIPGHGMFQF